jgi:hypothetical protein
LAKDPAKFETRVSGHQVRVDGAILIWGAVTSEGKAEVIAEHGFADVLSVETMVNDLRQWKQGSWIKMIEQLKCWSNELYDAWSGRM